MNFKFLNLFRNHFIFLKKKDSPFSVILLILILSAIIGCEDEPVSQPGGGPEDPPVPVYFDHPAWHPGGKWIAAEHSDSIDINNDGKNDEYFSGVWLINADNGLLKPFISGFSLPAWSPDGQKIALVKGGQIFTISVVNLKDAEIDTNSLKQLTDNGSHFYPDWSGDGQWIVYDSNINSPEGGYQIWKMKIDGSEKSKVTEGRMPCWSNDQKWIYYIGLYSEIYKTNSKGLMRVTNLNENNIYARDNKLPRYSPVGSKIAFYSKPASAPPAIWIMNNDGSNLYKASPDFSWRFDWSPDGKKFVFLYLNYQYRSVPGNGQLWVFSINDGGLKQLTYFSK